jgi:oligopeptide/dipeptide ABC transporter ATP-binding protein
MTGEILREPAPAPVLEVQDLKVWYPQRRGPALVGGDWNRAVDGVSFAISRQRTLALVGESGCGKSSIGRTTVRIQNPTSGRIRLLGEDITEMRGRALRDRRRHLQMVFQDPMGSLNPRRTVAQVLGEIASHHGGTRSEVPERVDELMAQVGLGTHLRHRLPQELSGGQRQRVGIARALATGPAVVICDEPVSALDVSIQAQIMNLLERLQRELGVAYLFISHDLAVVQSLAHDVAVMHRGRIVESGPVSRVFSTPAHPYTAALLASVPRGDPSLPRSDRIVARTRSEGDGSKTGCSYRDRCWAFELLGRPADCVEIEPALSAPTPGEQTAACHHSDDIAPIVQTDLMTLNHGVDHRKK